MTFLAEYKRTHAAPATAEAKEDLRVEAMAAGARLNVSCYVDAWRWYASAGARSRMAALYGVGNPYCAGTDGDGFTPLAGDCSDLPLFIQALSKRATPWTTTATA